MNLGGSKLPAIHQVERTEMSVAQLDGAFEDGLEDRLRIGPRLTDDPQDLGGRGLARQRLGQLTLQPGSAVRQGLVGIHPVRPRARLLGARALPLGTHTGAGSGTGGLSRRASSRRRYFWILPLPVIGNWSTK
jgi:hypothetical protein